jgi:RNA polymerase primary sigma factor
MNGSASQLKPTLGSFFRMAIIAGVERAVRIHIERGDNLNARDAGGQTPLMLAAARNKPHIFKLLLDAGADPLLTDSDGKTALFVAHAAGAREIASLLEPAFATSLEAVPADHASPFPADEVPANDDSISVAEAGQLDMPNQPALPDPAANAPSLPEIVESAPTLLHLDTDHNEGNGWSTAPIPVTVEVIDFDEDGATLDLSGWEAEPELFTPDGDPTVLTTAADVQNAISEHAPIDISADWDDFEAFLPERATPLPKADDAEARERLRALLLRATREGSVPNEAIADLTLNDDQTPNEEAGALLSMVVNDLGAEADERQEYSTHHENFAVHVEPRETPDEEQTVDDALAHIDELQSRRNDPLHLYLRAFQYGTLLAADEEVALGKAMEQGIEAALDALAGSITGIEAVLDESLLVKAGAKPLRWMSSGTRDDAFESGANQGESRPAKAEGSSDSESDAGPQDDSDDDTPDKELAEFIANAERLLAITRPSEAKNPTPQVVREVLGSLGLARSYLLALAESGRIAEPQSAREFKSAMQTYRAARDRMAVANLKLVYSIAKKYLYSGMPLDDLLQEGNIGLMKGVERFDWRRGFKFSTYATWWIRQQVSRFVADKAKTIRLPVHVYEKVQRIGQVSRAFETDNNRAPTAAEISELADLPLRKVEAYLQIAGEPLPIHELDIDSMIAADARDEYILPDPMEIVSDRDTSKVVQKILGTLKLKDENILRMRFGIGVSDAMTLDEIGTRMGVTRERIRQIEAKALRKLKHPSRLDALLAALNGNKPSEPKKNALDLSERESDDDDSPEPSKEADENFKWERLDEDERVQELVDAGATKPPRKNARKPNRIEVETPSFDTAAAQPTARANTVSVPVQKLLDAATVLGASVKVDQKGADNNIWIDFSKAPTTPPRPLIRKLVDSGFKFWPGKGYWR